MGGVASADLGFSSVFSLASGVPFKKSVAAFVVWSVISAILVPASGSFSGAIPYTSWYTSFAIRATVAGIAVAAEPRPETPSKAAPT